jgi:RimJ/RimL family protein N-acetyltransferase
MPGPTLVTHRLILRPPEPVDFEPWAAMMQEEEVARHLGGLAARPVVWRSMATMIGAWTLRGFSNFSVIDRASGEWLGRLGPWQPEGWPGTEIGWALKRASWGKGLAYEGARACMNWAFEELGWTEVIHCIAAGNDRSIRLAERLGARCWRSEQLPPPLEQHEALIFGQTRDEWLGRLPEPDMG